MAVIKKAGSIFLLTGDSFKKYFCVTLASSRNLKLSKYIWFSREFQPKSRFNHVKIEEEINAWRRFWYAASIWRNEGTDVRRWLEFVRTFLVENSLLLQIFSLKGWYKMFVRAEGAFAISAAAFHVGLV